MHTTGGELRAPHVPLKAFVNPFVSRNANKTNFKEPLIICLQRHGSSSPEFPKDINSKINSFFRVRMSFGVRQRPVLARDSGQLDPEHRLLARPAQGRGGWRPPDFQRR